MDIAGKLLTVSDAVVTEVNYALWRGDNDAQIFTNGEATINMAIGDLKWELCFAEVNQSHDNNVDKPYFTLINTGCLGRLYNTNVGDVIDYMAEFRADAESEGLVGLANIDIINLYRLLDAITPSNDSLGIETNIANFTYEVEVEGEADYVEKSWADLGADDDVVGLFASYSAAVNKDNKIGGL